MPVQPIPSGATGTRALRTFALSLLLPVSAFAADAPVSWFKDVTPIFKRSCNGCHNPNKTKGGVDTSTYALFAKPGKNGPNYIVGDPAKSILITEVGGKEPSMPKEGDPLSPAEVALLERWIREGAKDDTPADAYSTRITAPPAICGVVFQPGQFSFVRAKGFPPIARTSRHWQTAQAIAHIAAHDLWDAPVEDALFVHARRVNPRWRMQRIAAVGNHVFYR